MTIAALHEAGYDVSAAAAALLERFVGVFQKENEQTNLTSIKTPAEIWRLHICDSLALLPLISEAKAGRLLDLGTGGGVPGLPLACACPDLKVTLLDATRKKISAVERMAAAIGLANVAVCWGRAEELAHRPELRETFDVVVARAVAPLSMLLEYAAGFVRVGGACWFHQTRMTIERDAERSARVAPVCGLMLHHERTYRLPGDTQDRLIVEYLKTEPLAAELPRHPTVAKGRPIPGPLPKPKWKTRP